MKDFNKIIDLCKVSDGGATVDRNGDNAKGLFFASIYIHNLNL